jgi:hypothetical protein
MGKKTDTIDLKGKAYATVPARIKEFREACPNGLIETHPEPQTDGTMMFTARILKDKANPNSGEATGHSIGKITGDKNFEKLETIAIGRALAILGYMASGEIASSEEMEEFNKFKLEKHEKEVAGVIKQLKEAKDLAELQKIFVDSPVKSDKDVISVKDEMKLILK